MKGLIAALVFIILILAIAVYRLSGRPPQTQPVARTITFRYEPEALGIVPVFRPGDILDFMNPPKWSLDISPCVPNSSPCQMKNVRRAVYSYACAQPTGYCQDPEIVVDDTVIEGATQQPSPIAVPLGKQPPSINIGCDDSAKVFKADSPFIAPMGTKFVWKHLGSLGADWKVTLKMPGYCMPDNNGSDVVFEMKNRACTVLKNESFSYTIRSPSGACQDGTGMVVPN